MTLQMECPFSTLLKGIISEMSRYLAESAESSSGSKVHHFIQASKASPEQLATSSARPNRIWKAGISAIHSLPQGDDTVGVATTGIAI